MESVEERIEEYHYKSLLICRMVNCARCCLHNSMRALNFFVNIFGVVVIIYTLWLLKKWQDGVTELPPVPMVLKPWYITRLFLYLTEFFTLMLCLLSSIFMKRRGKAIWLLIAWRISKSIFIASFCLTGLSMHV